MIFITAKFRVLPEHADRPTTPEIVNFQVPQEGWSALGEMAVPSSGDSC